MPGWVSSPRCLADGAVDGLDRPRPGDLVLLAVLAGHGRAEGGGRGVLDEFADEVEHHVVVGEGLIGLAQGLGGGGAGADHLPGVGARDQVEVAAAELGLRVGQAPAFVGQGAQALAGELPGGDEDGRLALVADAGPAGGGDVVADVGVGGEAVRGGA
ncbi:Fic family protein 1 [Streptomyces azureus]|uniref:Fic family protein 1 n=1 Tax=Streptomyces azureus TaxID=146537 RepID=A0A0K8PXY4_STRAJ|nr:Fic family protein 1 [Streptomyces azureus]